MKCPWMPCISWNSLLSLWWARSIQSKSPNLAFFISWRSSLILSSHVHLSCRWSLARRVPHQKSVCIFHLYVLHASPNFVLIWSLEYLLRRTNRVVIHYASGPYIFPAPLSQHLRLVFVRQRDRTKFSLLLIYSCLQFLCVGVVPKYLNFATLSENLCPVLRWWFCTAF